MKHIYDKIANFGRQMATATNLRKVPEEREPTIGAIYQPFQKIKLKKYFSKNIILLRPSINNEAPPFTRGIYNKNFYCSNCCRIVISYTVCHFLSLPLQSNIWGQGLIIPEQSPKLDSALKVGSQSCPQILSQGGSDRKWQTFWLIRIRQQLLP